MSPELISLIIFGVIILYLIYLQITARKVPTEKLRYYAALDPSEIPMEYEGDLYWVKLQLIDPYNPDKGVVTYRMLADSGSDLITVPAASCSDCEGPRWNSATSGPSRRLRYQGGQEVTFQYSQAYSTELAKTLQISVMVSGSDNPNGPTINIFGLMNRTLHLRYLRINFRPKASLQLLPDYPTEQIVSWSPLHMLPHWAVPAMGLPSVQWLILDTGTNYVVVDSRYNINGGFQFTVGTTVIEVPASVIRYRPAMIPGTIVIGNIVMQRYNWIFDFIQQRVAIV